MTCRELIEFLDRYVEGELPADVRRTFDGHLATCPACRGYLRSYRDTIALARGAEREQPSDAPPELIDAILAAQRAGPDGHP